MENPLAVCVCVHLNDAVKLCPIDHTIHSIGKFCRGSGRQLDETPVSCAVDCLQRPRDFALIADRRRLVAKRYEIR